MEDLNKYKNQVNYIGMLIYDLVELEINNNATNVSNSESVASAILDWLNSQENKEDK